MPDEDPFDLLPYYEPLRVADVCDALDGIGYFNYGLMDRDVRPLWAGMRFWGVAFTVRCVPANRPMWKLNTTEEIVRAHGIWFNEMGNVRYQDQIRKGHVIVNATGGGQEVGQWGSANSLTMMAAGAVGIITDGYCRDTDEILLQKTPVCARERGRTITPAASRWSRLRRAFPAAVCRSHRATWSAATATASSSCRRASLARWPRTPRPSSSTT